MNRLTPIASQVLSVSYCDKSLDITLDSGANVSYLRANIAKHLQLIISPNDQLALLADEKTRMASMGEVDFLVTMNDIQMRIRALVMKNLQADCFGGTTFHADNDITTRIKTGEIKIHNSCIVQQSNPVKNFPVFPPPAQQYQPTSYQPNLHSSAVPEHQVVNYDKEESSALDNVNFCTISIPFPSVTMSDEFLSIPLPPELTKLHHISIIPSFPSISDKVTDGLH